MTMTLEQARTIIAAALATGHENGYAPLSVAVLDDGGHLTAFEREDGSSTHRFQIAHGKAYGAVALGVGSRALGDRAEREPHFISSATGALGGQLIPVPGGVLAKDEHGATVGAVGVTGDLSDNDEVAAVAGVEAAGFTAVTG